MTWIHLVLVAALAAPQPPEIPPDADVETLAFDVPTTEIAPETGPTEIVVLGREPRLRDAWLEITHLASERPSLLVRVDPSRDPFTVVPDLPPGPTLLCSGARGFGVSCERIYRGDGDQVGLPWVEAQFLEGVEVRGFYRQDLEPVEGARVALVPAHLDAFRPFTLPLEARGSRVVREVPTDADGHFRLPPIGPGEYFLETVLPSGRVHRSEAFEVPERATLEIANRVPIAASTSAAADAPSAPEFPRAPTGDAPGAPEIEELFVDLGRIDVPTGLDVELRVLDPAGEPIGDAAVFATQGETAYDVLSFEGTSDAEGRVVLHGLDVEKAVRLGCWKEGFEKFEQEYELLPVSVDCVLRPWATVTGEVIGPDSLAPPGATVSLRLAGEEAEPESVAVATDGRFTIGALAAGDYELRAAAPGYRVEDRTFRVDPGQEADLGAILLLFGRQVDGRVVDARSGAPIAGVDIVSSSPPGAVVTYSDIDGEFSFDVESREPLVLVLATFDYARRELTLSPDDLRSEEPLLIELEPAGWILVDVDGEDGLPCQGCRVVIWPGGEELWTDALGEALSGPLGAGRYRVSRPRITHLGSTVVEQPGAETYRAHVRPGRLTVVRLSGGGRTIRVRVDGDLEGVWTLTARNSRRAEKLYPDDDGAFAVRQRGGESLELFLNRWDQELAREISIWQATLPAGLLSDRFPLRLSESLVRGRVMGLEGPLAGAEVRLVSFADGSLRAVVYVDSDGGFRVPHVRPGVYTLYVGPRSVKFLSVGERQSVDLGTFELFLDTAAKF